MGYKPGDPYSKEFTTASPTTGAATNADSSPTATADFDGTGAGSMALTVSFLDTGRYKATGTIPSGRVRADVLNVSVAATVGTIAGKAVIDTQTIEAPFPVVNINYAQVGIPFRALDSVADNALTNGDALASAIGGAVGKQAVVNSNYLVKTPFTGTVLRTFTLDDPTTPTTRT